VCGVCVCGVCVCVCVWCVWCVCVCTPCHILLYTNLLTEDLSLEAPLTDRRTDMPKVPFRELRERAYGSYVRLTIILRLYY